MTPNTITSPQTKERVTAFDSGAIVAAKANEVKRELTPHPSVRQILLRRFEVWLDDVLAVEDPPAGIPADILAQLKPDPARPEPRDRSPDMVTLWAVMLRMVEETRIQGQTFERVHQDLKPIQSLIGSVSALQQEYETTTEAQQHRLVESVKEAAIKEMLDLLIETREQLSRGEEAARRDRQQMAIEMGRRRGLLERLKDEPRTEPDELVGKLIKKNELYREQIDGALLRQGVQPIECQGRPFDRLTMKEVEVDQTSEAQEGTVVEVCWPGYRRHDTVYRPAEVKVARRGDRA